MGKRLLTLDIGAQNVSLAEYESGGGGKLKLLKYGTAKLEAPLESGDAATILAPALGEIVRESGIRPGPVTVSVPGPTVFPRFASIAAAGGEEKFEQQVRFEIEQNVPFPIDEMVCDRQVLGENEAGERNVMVVAAKIEQIETITGAVASAGFTPELVDAAPVALTNAVRFAHPEDGCVVILDIGAKTTTLVISEGDRLYTRSIPIAGQTITRDVAQALGCTPEEAEATKFEKGYVSAGGVEENEDETADLVSKVCRAVLTRLQAEISRSVNFYRSQQGGSAPEKLYLTGGTSLLPNIDAFFAEALQVEVVFFNPFERIATASGLDADAVAADALLIGTTAGLALHAAGAAKYAINLLPPSLVLARAEKARVPVVAAAGVALVAALALAWLAVGHSAAVVRATMEGVERKAEQLKAAEGRVKKAQAEVAATAAAAESLRNLLVGRGTALQRIEAVRAALLPGMWIEKWEDGKVTVRYWASSSAANAPKPADAAKKPADAKKSVINQPQSERVAAKLKANSAIAQDGVKVVDMTYLGRRSELAQFTMEVKFK